MDWRSLLGLDAPQASSTARPVGQDELGNWIYTDTTGARYSVGTQPVSVTDAQRNDAILMRLGLLPPDPQTPDPSAAVNALVGAVTNGFSAPANALRGEMVTYGDALDTAGVTALGGSAMPAPQNALRANSFRAYHGSPHDFDKFSLDKIGTGEGAQAYGHGLYFAEKEDVAKGYQTNNSATAALRYDGKPITDETKKSVAWYLEQNDGDKDAVIQQWRSMYKPSYFDSPLGRREMRALENMDPAKLKAGNMYEVNINADPADFLDWDKPLSEQPAKVRDALQRGTFNASVNMSGGPSRLFPDNARGPDFLDVAKYPEAVGELRRQGLPGIKYLDQGSRGGGGDGSRNYVVFDDKLIDIVRKYGWAAAAPIFAQYGMTPEQAKAQYEGQM